VAKDQTHAWPGQGDVVAVDTTAAGDVWNGAFATALSAGAGEEVAGAFANAAAQISVTRPGAQPSMPGRSEVEDRLGWRLESTGGER
jgi:ribokinase